MSLCFNWAPCHEGVLGEWKYSSTHSLTSALDGGEWSALRRGCFTPSPRERAPGAHWIGGWVGPRAILDAVVKRKIPSSRRESNPRTPIVQPVAQHYTNWAITAHTAGSSMQALWTAVNEWIINTGLWLSHSLHLNKCDFYLWGNLKRELYRYSPCTMEALQIEIQKVVQETVEGELQCVFQNNMSPWNCLDVGEDHIQKLL
jgi:hypothetical protein